MPRKEINYQNTIIYKIVCNDLNIKDLYVGHTTDFRKRKSQHKENCEGKNIRKSHYNIYKFINENSGWGNCSMIEIEKYPCNDSNEATARERYWFEALNAKLNSKYPQRSEKEYIEMNKELISKTKKMYYEKNADIIKEKVKNNYLLNKEAKLLYQKQYREDNIDKIKEEQKKYRENNKDKINEIAKQKIICDCG